MELAGRSVWRKSREEVYECRKSGFEVSWVREEDAEGTVEWVTSPEGSHPKTKEKKDTC